MGSNHGNLTKFCRITVGVTENSVEQLKPLLINSQGGHIITLEESIYSVNLNGFLWKGLYSTRHEMLSHSKVMVKSLELPFTIFGFQLKLLTCYIHKFSIGIIEILIQYKGFACFFMSICFSAFFKGSSALSLENVHIFNIQIAVAFNTGSVSRVLLHPFAAG